MSQSRTNSESSFARTPNLELSPKNVPPRNSLVQNQVMAFFDDQPPQNDSERRPKMEPSKVAKQGQIDPETSGLRFGGSPQYIVRGSGDTKISVFGNSIKMDREILEVLGAALSSSTLKKADESEYFSEMNVFDQEWEFPFNKRHFEYSGLLGDIDANPLEVQVDLYKKSLIEMQVQLRNLSEFFIKVDRERLFFRQKLVQVLQAKVGQLVEVSPELKKLVGSLGDLEAGSSKDEISRLKKKNKESQSLFVNLKRRNVKLEEEAKQLKKKLKEKRAQLKKYMFRKDGQPEDNMNTRTTINSNNQGASMETSTVSREVPKSKGPIKFSSTILPKQPNSQGRLEGHQFNPKNKSHLQIKPRQNMGLPTDEGPPPKHSLPKFLQDSANSFQKAFVNKHRDSRHGDRTSIQTESGTVEIPPLLVGLGSQRKSRLSGLKVDAKGGSGRRESGFKLMNKVQKPPGKLSNKLLNIKKRNSKLGSERGVKNPFTFKKFEKDKNERKLSKESSGSKGTFESNN